MGFSKAVRARVLVGTVGMATLLAALLSGPGAAMAAPTGGVRDARAAGAVDSCSYDLGTATLVCVHPGEDLNRAVLDRAHLRVVAPLDARGAVVDTATPAGAQTTFVQSQLYDDVGYGGAFFQITNSSSCNGSTVWYFGPLGNVGWSGRVSSFKSFSGCSTKLWQGTNYSGASYGYAVDASSLGSMNDQANSVTLR